MSQINAKSPQHCAKKKLINLSNVHKKILYTFTTFLSSIILLLLLIWFILHPTNPHFSLQQADIYQLSLSGPGTRSLVNSSIQLTLVSVNPNQRVGIYYDKILVYAAYKGQQITLQSVVDPFYQGCKETDVVSAILVAELLPVAPSFGYDLVSDEIAGRLVLSVKVNGLLRWKVGTWVSGKYRFDVKCVVVFSFGLSGPLSFKQGARCRTTV